MQSALLRTVILKLMKGKSTKRKKDKRKSIKKPTNANNSVIFKSRPTLALALIMKDEIDDLNRIISDYGQFFDKIYVTVTHRKTYLTLRKSFNSKLIELSYFKWIDHFGKARRYNQHQIKTNYWMWIDLDDEIVGADRLADTVNYMESNNLGAVWFQYDYIRHDESVGPTSVQWKVRVIKTSSELEWSDEAVHENIYIQEGIQHKLISERDIVIRHRKTSEELPISAERNRAILLNDWKQKPRAMTAHYLGRDYVMAGDHQSAIDMFLYVTQNSVNLALKFDAWQSLCESYFQTGNYAAALAAANEAMSLEPDHPGPRYQRFAVYWAMGEHKLALESAEIAMTKKVEGGDVGILLDHDPTWYQYKAPFNVARAYLAIGDNKKAYEIYSSVKKIAPQYIDELSKADGIQWHDVFEGKSIIAVAN